MLICSSDISGLLINTQTTDMKFDIQNAIQILERTPRVVDAMLRGLDDSWTMTNEGGETWTAYDVIGHYIHGERTDWIPRMFIILNERADKCFEPFDRFAQFLQSRGKSLHELLDEFSNLRRHSIEQLKEVHLNEELLTRTGIHPKFGAVTLSQLLSAWVVHDLTHIYQISRIMARQYDVEVGPWKEFMGILNDR